MVSCTGFIEPLNLECLLVNTFAGSMEVFALLSFMVIMALAAFFRMSNMIALGMLSLFAVIMSTFIGFHIYTLVIFITGLFIFWGIQRIIK